MSDNYWIEHKEKILSTLEDVHTQKNGRIAAVCPYCQKGKEHFSIDPAEGVFKCLHCNQKGNARSIVRDFSIPIRYEKQKIESEKIVYNYTTSAGQPIYRKIEIREGHKRPLWLRGKRSKMWFESHTASGGWVRGLNNVNKTILSLGSVLNNDIIFYVEGEKCARAVESLGYIATTSGGANDWRHDFKHFFRGKHVYIIPDCDDVGRNAASIVLSDLYPVAATVRVIELDLDRVDGYDIADVVDEKGVNAARFHLDQLVNQCLSIRPRVEIPILPIDYIPTTDAANAERFFQVYGHRVRYLASLDQWLVWDGSRWAPDETESVTEFAKEISRRLMIEADQIPEAARTKRVVAVWNEFITRSQNSSGVRAMISLAKSHPRIAVRKSSLNSHKNLINLENGTFDLASGEFRDHKPTDLITKRAPVYYDERASCPNWLKFLGQIFKNDQATIKFVQTSIGMSLSGRVDQARVFFLLGTGANGKSVFIDTITSILGEYSVKTPTDTLMVSRQQQNASPDLARLESVRLVYATETQEGARLDEQKIKEITGGEEITARALYQDYIQFKPEFTLFVSGNHAPTFKGSDYGIRRRLVIINFPVQFAEKDRIDRSILDRHFWAERSGIFNWAAEGHRNYLKNGLEIPTGVQKATDDYIEENDTIGEFLSDHLERFSGSYTSELARGVTKTDLYEKYKTWAEANGLGAKSSKSFSMTLRDRIPTINETRGKQRIWENIQLI